jgi:preprotein translocase subunit YajC
VAEQIAGLLPLILIIAVGYLLIIRPARKRQRDLIAVQRQLAPGVQVMTSSGLYATVREVSEGSVVLETSPGVRSTWARNAISRVESPAGGQTDQTLDLTDSATDAAAAADAPTEAAPGSTEQGADGRRTDRPGS